MIINFKPSYYLSGPDAGPTYAVTLGHPDTDGIRVGRVERKEIPVPSRNAIKWGTRTVWVAFDRYGGKIGEHKTRKAAAEFVATDSELLSNAERGK